MPKSKTYEEFVEKFKPKKTTDDCMTPPLVYDAVKTWACEEYGIDPANIIRPFWPGADYTAIEYPENCVVIDNPPFSILAQICEWYLDRKIKFFLFAPTLTALTGKKIAMRVNHIICYSDVIYENGAVVHTSFLTNLGDRDIVAQTSPELGSAVKRANDETQKNLKKHIPKYEYPDHILTATMMKKYCRHGIKFEVRKNECVHASKLDAQIPYKKAIYGGGLLLSNKKAAEKAAAERAAAERAAVHVWTLSDREIAIINGLDE